MKEPTYKTREQIVTAAVHAINQVEAAKKQADSGYNEDLRKYRTLVAKLTTTQMMNEPELFSIESVLSPDLENDLRAPLAKYER